MGSLRVGCFFDRETFWVLLLSYFCLTKVPGRTFVLNLSKFVTFEAAPLVSTPFVRNYIILYYIKLYYIIGMLYLVCYSYQGQREDQLLLDDVLQRYVHRVRPPHRPSGLRHKNDPEADLP